MDEDRLQPKGGDVDEASGPGPDDGSGGNPRELVH